MDSKHKEKINNFYQLNKRMPSYSEMMKMFGYKSKNAVYRLVNKMMESGLVAKDKLGRLIPSKALGEIPLLGTVKAGIPSTAEEDVLDTISLEDLFADKNGSTYMLEVDGDSMIEAHIEEGDLVIVEKSNQAKDGQIVIAEVDGEFTMKYYKNNGKKVWLEPANKNYKAIHPEESLNVIAIVKGVIRKY